MKNRPAVGVLLAALSLALAGCAVNTNEVTPAENSQASTEFSMNDIMFAQMMIPHHEQAVDLAALAETNTSYAIILDLASRIASAQQPEIDEMRAWLTEAGVDVEMDHSMSMPGLVSDADMAEIEKAQGDDFDVLFLTHMIAHHKGAVDMANDVLASTTSPRVRELATAIVASQTAEIAEMEALLYG
jgi:uncharacterized protein (DUF305 family)